MKTLVTALFLSIAFSVSADTLTMAPIAPTSVDPIQFRVPVYCGGRTVSATRVGNVLKMEVETFGLCSPPIRSLHVIPFDPLPPGTYRAELFYSGIDNVQGQIEFVVRNGGPAQAVVHPFTVPAHTTSRPPVRIERTDGQKFCQFFDCSDSVITIGGKPVTDMRPEGSGYAAWFTPPVLEPGLYAIDIRHGDAIERVEGAIYYFDEPIPSVFEAVLFPVLDDLNGANGSHWVSEAVIANANLWFAENVNSLFPFVCIDYPCGERLAPRSYGPFSGKGYPHGAILRVSRNEADLLNFSLRVRDTSRAKEGFGTQIPVVRERDMSRTRTLALLDVPRDPRYRVKIRAYAVPPLGEEGSFWSPMSVVNPETNAKTLLTLSFTEPTSPYRPLYAEMDLPAGAEGERSVVYVQPVPETLTWVFATVTNNETQQVTIITPNGGGPEPCTGCVLP
jgi:hypothetical protein